MQRHEVLSVLATHQDALKALGVKSLVLFGSVARNEATPSSDTDFLVEFNEQGGLFQLFRVQHYLEDILECLVDLGTQDALKEHVREPVLEDVIHVF